jgi:excisionase family DNA binding protein
MSQKLLTKREAADVLNVSPRTVNRFVAARRLKAIKVGNVFRVDPAEIERFKQRHTT